jgi:enoyl-CoA hydratase/carnithine racemase
VSYEQIRLEILDAVATITLHRPEALNAITVPMLEELAAALDEVAVQPGVAVVVLTGEGRAFSAGVDLKALGDRSLEGGAVGDYLDLPARAVIERIAALHAVVIAKVNGFCFTGALELALACDLVVTADEAKLGDTHAQWGLRPSWGMSQRLPRAVGPARARLLSYTARQFTGRQAEEWGLAALSCPAADLDAVVAEICSLIASHSRGALAAYKDLYRASERLPLPDGLAYEASTPYPIADTESRIAQFR